MSFIIGLCGFILGIGIVVLLGVVGYYADKKNNLNVDKKMNNVENGNNNIFNSFNQLPNVDNTFNATVETDIPVGVPSNDNISNDNGVASVMDTFNSSDSSVLNDNIVSNIPEYVNSTDDSNISNDVVPENDSSNVSNEQANSFTSSDFENTNMSLDDLEKKNYEEIVTNGDVSDNENYYYSNFDDNVSEDSSFLEDNDSVDLNNSSNESIDSVDDNSDVSTPTGINSDISESLPQSGIDKSSDVSDVSNSEVIEGDIQTSNDLSLNNEDSSGLVSEHVFDGEIYDNNSETDSLVSQDDSASIPELFGGFDNSVDENNHLEDVAQSSDSIGDNFSVLNSDSSDDDIWKF